MKTRPRKENGASGGLVTAVLLLVIIASLIVIGYKLGWIFKTPAPSEAPELAPTPTPSQPVIAAATPSVPAPTPPPGLEGLSQGYLALLGEASAAAKGIAIYRGSFLNSSSEVYGLDFSFSSLKRKLPQEGLSDNENAALALYADANINLVQSNKAYLTASQIMAPLKQREFACSDKASYLQAAAYLYNATLSGNAAVEDLDSVSTNYPKESAAIVNLTETVVFLDGFFEGLNSSLDDLRSAVKAKCP
jgi:hypothetical protein